MALSFILTPLTGATHLQCFAAGASLCSTSLGTILTVLHACSLGPTRLGVVLTSAAMLDDVAGLVMVQVISNLSVTTSEFTAVTVIRPVFVSVAFCVCAVVICRFVLVPAQRLLLRPGSWVCTIAEHKRAPLVSHIILLVGAISASSYAGTSNLLAAYIAGAVISWWTTLDSSQIQPQPPPHGLHRETHRPDATTEDGQVDQPAHKSSQSDVPALIPQPVNAFEHYFQPALVWVLQPFFFASVGFSIPITRMFTAQIVWKGIIYTILMMLGKVVCGLWLIRVPGLGLRLSQFFSKLLTRASSAPPSTSNPSEVCRVPTPGPSSNNNVHARSEPAKDCQQCRLETEEEGPTRAATTTTEEGSPNATRNPPNPLSLYPASILGLAMVPRGEIGFLISAVAQSGGIFDSETRTTESDIFLIVTWAIVLCTVVGPLCVGILVRRVRRLTAEKGELASQRNVLGVWGC